jgi:hypothetical protein
MLYRGAERENRLYRGGGTREPAAAVFRSGGRAGSRERAFRQPAFVLSTLSRRPACHPALANISFRTPSATVAARTRAANAPWSYWTRRSAAARTTLRSRAPSLARAHVDRAALPTCVKIQNIRTAATRRASPWQPSTCAHLRHRAATPGCRMDPRRQRDGPRLRALPGRSRGQRRRR